MTQEASMTDGMRFLEDFEVGERWMSTPTVITEQEIIEYARVNDPQPMHTDPEKAKSGPFAGLVASGWQIAAMSMRLFIQSGGYGKTPVVGLGIEELRWKKPVRPGDRLTAEREVVEIKRSEKHAGRGTIRTRVDMRNQNDEVVMTLYTLGMVPTRPHE